MVNFKDRKLYKGNKYAKSSEHDLKTLSIHYCNSHVSYDWYNSIEIIRFPFLTGAIEKVMKIFQE